MPLPEIPVILTVADWNAKKGTIAKMAGETGIGAALAKLKVEFDKVPWDVLDPDSAYRANTKTGKGTLALAQKLGPIAISNQSKLEPVRKQLQAIKTLTETIEKKWKASKIIPFVIDRACGQDEARSGSVHGRAECQQPQGCLGCGREAPDPN
ncbi:MAG: hypothetical protein IPO29_06180 [Anaerolineae bacterium]|nr:hypothetical protein [Anaerolineae bacterium]